MIISLRNLVATVTVALTVAVAANAWAQAPTAAQVALTPEIVGAFVASYPEIRRTADDLSDEYGVEVGDGNDLSAAWQAWLAITGAQSALNAICQSYGFAGFQPWLQVFTSVATAYAFATGGGEMDAQMAAALARIQNDPNIPDAQKQMLIDQMQASMGVVAAIAPPQQNIDAVTPYVDQLAVLFEDA